MRLEGIDGTQLLGFMAGLGTLALLDARASARGEPRPKIAFTRDGIADLHACGESPENVVEGVFERLQALRPFFEQTLAAIKNPSDFTAASFAAVARASDREAADILAGLACHLGCEDEKAVESSLCAANGASHQSLIQSIRDVLALVEREHLNAALFRFWIRDYEVPDAKRKQLGLGSRNPTLRLDPADERLYALRLTNPTTTKDFKTELGAQALAIPAFSVLPVLPLAKDRGRPVAVSSRRSGNRITFSWCLWELPASLPTVRSLLFAGTSAVQTLQARGAFAAFRADRVTGEKGKLSFTPAVGLW